VHELLCNGCTQALDKPVYAQFKFDMVDNFDHDSFFSNEAKVTAFKDGVVQQLSARLSMPASAIKITNIYKGSIMVELSIDTVGLNQNQLQTVVGLITTQTASLFTPTFLATYGVKSVSAKLLDPPVPSTNIPAIVGGVVGGVGGALLVGGVTWFIIKKR